MLDHLGDAHSVFQNYLFTSECISAYLTRSKSNVVVCELQDSCNEGYESFGFPLSQTMPNIQTQPNLQYLSQSEQMGYGMLPLSQLEQIGYELVTGQAQLGYGLSDPL